MTRKDFQLVANVLRESGLEPIALKNLTVAFGRALRAEHPRFNYSLFRNEALGAVEHHMPDWIPVNCIESSSEDEDDEIDCSSLGKPVEDWCDSCKGLQGL